MVAEPVVRGGHGLFEEERAQIHAAIERGRIRVDCHIHRPVNGFGHTPGVVAEVADLAERGRIAREVGQPVLGGLGQHPDAAGTQRLRNRVAQVVAHRQRHRSSTVSSARQHRSRLPPIRRILDACQHLGGAVAEDVLLNAEPADVHLGQVHVVKRILHRTQRVAEVLRTVVVDLLVQGIERVERGVMQRIKFTLVRG